MPRDTSTSPVQPRAPAPAPPGRPSILRQARDGPGSGRTERPRRRYVRFTSWRRRRFFLLLGESGNVRLACELSGVGLGCVYRLRRTEPGFVALMAAAVARADERLGRGVLRDADERGPDGGVLRDASPGSGPGSAAPRDERGLDPPPPCGRSPSPAKAKEDLSEEGLVIRRGRGGRLRMMAAGDHWWCSRHDALFLGHLRVTGNVTGSAKAAGFTAKSAWNRRDRLASFARAWDAALEEAEERLQGEMLGQILTGTLGMDPDGPGQEEAAAAAERGPFDVWLAIWLLSHWEAQRQGRIRPRRGPGGP